MSNVAPRNMHAISSSSLLAAAILLPAVFAHYNFEALIVNGNVTSAYEYVRQTNNSNSPITDITSTDMICNSGGLRKLRPRYKTNDIPY